MVEPAAPLEVDFTGNRKVSLRIAPRYEVWFLYNARGRASWDHCMRCVLPEGLGPEDLARGFWIDDHGETMPAEVTYGGSSMWVPPGRITSVLRYQEPSA